jgi:hypothetical protein
MKIPDIPIRGYFSWSINYDVLWELAACGVAIVVGYLLFLIYQDAYNFVFFAFVGYIGAKILIWLHRGGFN